MSDYSNGLWLEQYVEPQLLKEFRDFNDDFIGTLKRPNKAAIGKDGIKFNKLINNVGFHVNKDSDFQAKSMDGQKKYEEWDKLDTDPTEVTDKELRAMAFDKDSEVRKAHRESFQIGVRDYSMHALAPKQNVDGKMPVMVTTGDVFEGRKRLTYKNLVDFLTMMERLNLKDATAWYMILNSHHRGDLWHDRASTNHYRDIVIDTNTGMLKSFGKIKFFENNTVPIYNSNGVLKSFGAKKEQGDQEASIFYYAPNTLYHIESVEALYKPRKQDTESKDPKSTFRLHTYGLSAKRQEHGFGALVSANSK